MYSLRKQNWDKFFHYRPLTCLVQMCRLMIFIWSQWACSRRQTSLKIQARERWKILPSKLIGEHFSLHFWLRRYTHSVTLLKVSYDFFFFYHNEFFRKLNKSVLNCRKVERTSKASVLFQYICFIRDSTGNCLVPKICPAVLAMVLNIQQTWKYGKQIIV